MGMLPCPRTPTWCLAGGGGSVFAESLNVGPASRVPPQTATAHPPRAGMPHGFAGPRPGPGQTVSTCLGIRVTLWSSGEVSCESVNHCN